MSISIKTNRKSRVHMNEGMEGWGGSQGMRNQISAKSYGVFTRRIDSVSTTQEAERQAQEREELIGDGYGAAIRRPEQIRGRDQMRQIDYSGASSGYGFSDSNRRGTVGSSSGVGMPLGKNQTLSSIDTSEGITKEFIRGTAGNLARLPVYNVEQGDTNNTYSSFSGHEHRPIKSHETAPLKIDNYILNTSVEPTAVYLPKQEAGQDDMYIRSKLKEEVVNVKDAFSGTETMKRFELDKHMNTNTETIERLKVAVESGTRHLSKNETEHIIKELTSKIQNNATSVKSFRPKFEVEHKLHDFEHKLQASNVIPNKNDIRVNRRIQHENNIEFNRTQPSAEIIPMAKIEKYQSTYRKPYTLKDTRDTVAEFFPAPVIKRDYKQDFERKNFVSIKNNRPDLGEFSVDSGALYPV